MSVWMGGQTVTLTYHENGGSAEISIDSCPSGTGAVILSGQIDGFGRLTVIVHSTAVLEGL